MGEETSTSYLQQAAKAGVLGDVNADSIAALQFFPGKPRVTLEDGRVRLPGLIVARALLKLSKTKKMSWINDVMFMFVNFIYFWIIFPGKKKCNALHVDDNICSESKYISS